MKRCSPLLTGLFGATLALLTPGCGLLGEDDGGSGDTGDAGTGGEASGGNGGGTGGAASGPPAFIEAEAPVTLAHADAYDAMADLLGEASFTAENLGDPTRFSSSGATTPSEPTRLASLYFETDGLNAAVQQVQDTRTGITPTPDLGAALAQDFVQDLTLGAVSDAPPDERGGARFAGWHAVRTLDAYLLLRAIDGLSERSGTGFDRAVGLLWDAEGHPHGLGRRIAEGDAACGGDTLGELQALFVEVREPFATALTEKGELDALDRKKIQIGDSPDYDAFLPNADRLLHAGLAKAFVAGLQVAPLTSLAQAQGLATYTALSARVMAVNPDGDTYIGQQLDQSLPSVVDVAGKPGMPGISGLITAAFGITCAP
jgi:hypothetical protein